ncbi:MAG: TetR/AcrR family transcriptional regulator [Bryobacterales bacterium]|nr:TetR/AcrR family transcriptional regulator [Bryobacterales bacterium]MBV9396808.1 TetR/AcrR family transcriptional regulator [Bryobacterales bacterium]
MQLQPNTVSGPLPSPRRLSSDDRRRQLIRTAVDLFSRHGFSGTRTKDIAAACGVSEAILFRHFATKEDLYRAILDDQQQESGADEWMVEMRALADKRDDAGLLRCLISQIVKSFRENTAFHRLMMFAALDGHALADLFHERMGLSTYEFLRGYVERRQKEGAFRKGDPGAAVLCAIAAAKQYASGKYLFGIKMLPLTDDAIVEQLTTMVLNGIGNGNGARKGHGARK